MSKISTISYKLKPVVSQPQPTPAPAKFDYLGLINEPFAISAGGYALLLDPSSGTYSYVFGEAVLPAIKASKIAGCSTRLANRCNKVSKVAMTDVKIKKSSPAKQASIAKKQAKLHEQLAARYNKNGH